MTDELFGRTGYDRIVGALANLGHHISDQIVGDILSGIMDPILAKVGKKSTIPMD